MTLEHFSALALSYDEVVPLAGKCGIFIESALVNLQRRGVKKSNLAMAVCLSLAENYLRSAGKNIGLESPIVFQGGVAKLRCMRKAFEMLLNQEVTVPANSEYMGAIGIALLTIDNVFAGSGVADADASNGTHGAAAVRDCRECMNNCRGQVDFRVNEDVRIGKCGKQLRGTARRCH